MNSLIDWYHGPLVSSSRSLAVIDFCRNMVDELVAIQVSANEVSSADALNPNSQRFASRDWPILAFGRVQRMEHMHPVYGHCLACVCVLLHQFW